MKITRKQISKIIQETLLRESENKYSVRRNFLKSQFEEVGDGFTSYPYGRYRGDVRSSRTYRKIDGTRITNKDMAILTAIEIDNHPLGGITKHTLSDDGKTVEISYYKHTSG